MLRELELRRDDRKALLAGRHAGEPLPLPDRVGQFLAVQFAQPRLVIEQFQLRRPARLEQIDDALGLGRKVRLVLGREAIARQQARQRGGAGRGSRQELSAIRHESHGERIANTNGLTPPLRLGEEGVGGQSLCWRRRP